MNGAVDAGATTITLASATSFASSGNGFIGGDSFKWTGKSSNDLTGVTGVSYNHSTGETVEQGEFGQVLREICADLAAAYYMEDEGTFSNKWSRRHDEGWSVKRAWYEEPYADCTPRIYLR